MVDRQLVDSGDVLPALGSQAHPSLRPTCRSVVLCTWNYNVALAVPDPVDITGLLKAWGRGDQCALDELTPLVYAQLRAQARRCMRSERSGLTLQSTALVHEAYLRLVNSDNVDWHDRVHFFALCAQIMRRILIDAARARSASKRGGGQVRVDHSSAVDLDQIPTDDSSAAHLLCALDDALESLRQIDPRRVKVIELRFFGGLSVEETAEVLQISPQTVMRDWRLARAWLARELHGDGAPLA
jgi:RNA polymerase sigma factor (TIGR02999 family)